MSSTLAPATLSPNNPINRAAVTDTLAKLGLAARDRDVADYTSLLAGIWEIWNNVHEMDDYVPEVNETKFPRKDVHFPGKEENPANAWAWKVSVKDVNAKGGLLEGKTVCLKVSGATGTFNLSPQPLSFRWR
jgi:amidase